MFEITRTVKGQNNLKQKDFLTCYLALDSDTLEKLKFKLEKIIEIQKCTG